MQAIPVTIVGSLTNAQAGAVAQQVVLRGLMIMGDLQIWGGGNEPFPTPPIYFPPGWGGEQPPGFWGPNDPRPTPPINLPPWGWTGGKPPGTWGGAGEPFPTPPIFIPVPRPPEPYPQPPDDEKPPPENGGWGYDSDIGWYWKPPPTSATPKK